MVIAVSSVTAKARVITPGSPWDEDVRLGSSQTRSYGLSSEDDQHPDWNSLFPTSLTQILTKKPVKRDKYQTDFGSVLKRLL